MKLSSGSLSGQSASMLGLGMKFGLILKNGLISARFAVRVRRCEKMRKTLKIAAVAAVAFLALGAVAFAYAFSQNGATANANEQTGMQNMQTFFESDNVTCPYNVTMPGGHMSRMPQMRANGLQWIEGLSQNATLANVSGTVVSEVKGMLILDTSSGQVRVLLPKDWTIGTEVVDRNTLFNGTFASSGQSVTIEVLESNLFSNANFSINEMLGYEAINATNTQAYAVLPFNIQPNS
jgi:RNase P/RNase MRP subunit p29